MGRKSWRNSAKLIGALLIPPLPAMFIGTTLFLSLDDATTLSGLQVAGALAFIATVVVGYPAMLLLGLPGHALLHHFEKSKLWHYAIAGALAGIVAVFVTSALDGRFYRELLPLSAIVGVANAALFWLIRRPDRDPANPVTRAP